MKKKNKKSIILALVILSVLGLMVLFVLPRLNGFSLPYERDEGEYAYDAWLLRQGYLPYQEDFLQKPPAIAYTYLLAQLVSPQSLWPIRLLAYLFTVGTILLTVWITKKEFGNLSGWVVAWVLTGMFSFPYLLPLTLPEVPHRP